MSNSSLVSYIKMSPNYTKMTNKKNKKITIHHAAYNASVESLGAGFANPNRDASSNYGIGSDGRIGLYVDEANRSWCSSDADNDGQAVTIEVANDEIGGNWHVSDKAMESLINLCVDICERNGIEKLIFTGDASGNLTQHNYFAYTLCPGPYLKSKFPYIANEVNKRLGASNVTGTASTGSDADNKKIWDFLMKNIGNEYGVAGLMGNILAESGMRSDNMEDVHQSRLGYNDKTYTSAVDNGTYDNFVKDSVGYGLAQWTYHARKQALLDYARSQKKSIGDMNMQLEFLIKELKTSFKNVIADLKDAKSVLDASNSVLLKFECPADQSKAVQKKRADYGQMYYDKYATKTSVVKFKVGDEVKLLSGATYYNGQSMPTWLFDMKLYVREINGENIVISTLKSGAITGTVKDKYLTFYADKAPVVKPEPDVPTSGFQVVDTVKLVPGAKYISGKSVPDWLFNMTIYVRGVNGNKITISRLKSGDITGTVDAKYLTKNGNVESKPVESSLQIGDKVKLATGATYYNGQKIPAWVFNMPLYVRGISGDNITISTLKSGAITGTVNKKHLTKC